MSLRASGDHGWELLKAGHAGDAAAEFDRLIRSQPVPELSWLVNRGLSLAACGKFREAADSLMQADNLALRPKATGFRYLSKIAQLLWLAGERRRALEVSRQDVEEIRDGKREYGDFAGGVSNGLVLFFAGVTLRDSGNIELALKFLRSLAKNRARLAAWPGPVARFVLSGTTLGHLLTRASGLGDLKWALHKTQSDLVARREMTQALFYAATKFRFDGLEDRCLELMTACGEIPNPLIELEWYIARSEIADPRS